MKHLSSSTKWLLTGALFALCIGPTFISYRPYAFRWDDSVYLLQSIQVSRAFWASGGSGIEHLRAIRHVMVSDRPPAMTLLGMPWGSLGAWDAAGKCFVTLGAWIALVAGLCFLLLARIGVNPAFLVSAGLCLCAALGPWPAPAIEHFEASALMADSLFAWTCLAALLLIPHEARTEKQLWPQAVGRGILWGSTLSLGIMIKISFFYFAGLILPVLLILRLRRGGLRSCRAVLGGFLIASAPAAAYLLCYGRSSFENGGASSFGALAKLYKQPLLHILQDVFEGSPGFALYLAGLLAALVYLAIKRRAKIRWPDAIAALIACGFALIVFVSPNLQIRYAFPSIVALPFLFAVLLSDAGESVPRRPAALTAALVSLAFIAAAFLMQSRAARQNSLGRADAVLTHAMRCGDGALLLATSSPALNADLLQLSIATTQGASGLRLSELASRTMNDLPRSGDFQMIDQADAVAYQDRVVFPRFANLRAEEYKHYLESRKEYVPVKVWDDVTVYTKHCSQSQIALVPK